MNAIEVQALRCVYQAKTGILRRAAKEVVAVEGVSFAVAQGELLGLLGPNGAGKTTTIKMLTTLLIPTSGAATILGFDLVKQAEKVRPLSPGPLLGCPRPPRHLQRPDFAGRRRSQLGHPQRPQPDLPRAFALAIPPDAS
jgi:energy-coupling factor transporter ATP-binding protein EcfA2